MASGTGNLLPALHPTPEQQRVFLQAAQRRLDATVPQYLQHAQALGSRPRRELSRKHWKAIKSHDDLTVYKERGPQPVVSCDVGENWTDPKLLVATGTIVGELDDVMYGVVAPDTASMLLRASITKSRLIGGAVLNQMQDPMANEPYRFLGVKWFVMAPPATLNGVVRPRDAVFVEATGVKTLPNGARIGYQVMHSVDIPGYRSLEHHAILRVRLSFCAVFKQLANGTVDVYVRGYVGASSDSATLKMAVSVSLSSWNAVGCAQFKKLMWHVQHRLGRASSSSSAKVTRNPRSCADCNKRFGAFSSAPGQCIFCEQWLCSRCRVVSKLRDVDAELGLEEKKAVLCHKCVTHANRQSTAAVATQEVLSGRFSGPQRSSSIVKLWSFRSRSASRVGRESARASATLLMTDQDECFDDSGRGGDHTSSHAGSMNRRAMSDGGVMLFDPTRLYDGSDCQSQLSDYSSDSGSVSSEKVTPVYASFYGFDERLSEAGDGDEPVVCYPVAPEQGSYAMVAYDPQRQQHWETEPKRPNAQSKGAQQEQLWRQMLDLRVAAEQVYQMTMQTTDAQLRRLASLSTADAVTMP